MMINNNNNNNIDNDNDDNSDKNDSNDIEIIYHIIVHEFKHHRSHCASFAPHCRLQSISLLIIYFQIKRI